MNDLTQVIFVGRNVSRVSHYCQLEADFRRVPGSTETPIDLKAPTHFAVPAGFCPRCNILYVARYENEL